MFLNKDKTILKRLAKGIQSKRPTEVQNAMLKRYLLELTQSFMIPLVSKKIVIPVKKRKTNDCDSNWFV